MTTKTSTWNGDYMVRVQNLVRQFGELTAVDNISFDVRNQLGDDGTGQGRTDRHVDTLRKEERVRKSVPVPNKWN